MYDSIAPHLKAFDPLEEGYANSVIEAATNTGLDEFTRESPNLMFGDPRFTVQDGSITKAFNKATADHENPIFLKVLEQEKKGCIPKVDIVSLTGVGHVLVADDDIPKGTVIGSYQGEVLPAMFAPVKGEPGHDKLVTILHSKQSSARDIVISPYKRGNIPQFASTCSPKNDDWRHINAILVLKDVSLGGADAGRAVIPFLIVVKNLKPGDVVCWYYGDSYDYDERINWLTKLQLQEKVDAFYRNLEDSDTTIGFVRSTLSTVSSMIFK